MLPVDTDAHREIEDRVKQILLSHLQIEPGFLATTSSATPLLGRGIGLDSMETLTLVAAIEEAFDLQVHDDELTVDLFKNIGTLTEFIVKKTRQP